LKTFLISTLAAVMMMAGPALAGEHGGAPSGGGHPGGGGCMGGCGGGGGYGGGHPGGGGYDGGGGHPGHGGGYNTNVNVNVNATANASASAYSNAGAVINARGYDVGAIRGGGGYGGAVVSGSGYGGWDSLSYGGGAAAVVVHGPGYGPSRPFGYTVNGFGRRYVTTDRCGSCGAPPPPPPSGCHDRCGGGYPDTHGRDRYSDRRDGDHGRSHQGGGHDCGCEGPRYVAQPYYAAPLEPVDDPRYGYQGGSSSQSYGTEGYSQQSYGSHAYEGQSYGGAYYASGASGHDGAPVYVAPPQQGSPYEYHQAPADYSGDLPPGDDGVSMPYRQEPGERG